MRATQTPPASTETAQPCHQCGSDRGAFRQLADGRWECLSHSPKLGSLADRRNGRAK